MLNSTIELYQILTRIAAGTPVVIEDGREVTCRRLQSLAVCNDYDAAAATDTLGKDSRYIGKNIFYSRTWYDAGQSPAHLSAPYPQLVLGAMRERVTTNGASVSINYTVAIIDTANRAQGSDGNDTTCDGRTEEEVESDLRGLYLQFVADVSDMVYASVTNATNPADNFANLWVSRLWLADFELTDPAANTIIHDDLLSWVDFDSEASFTKTLGTSDTYAYVASMQVRVKSCRQPRAIVPPIAGNTLANTPCC